jgi:predicted PurR-regulated permease PerM
MNLFIILLYLILIIIYIYSSYTEKFVSSINDTITNYTQNNIIDTFPKNIDTLPKNIKKNIKKNINNIINNSDIQHDIQSIKNIKNKSTINLSLSNDKFDDLKTDIKSFNSLENDLISNY